MTFCRWINRLAASTITTTNFFPVAALCTVASNFLGSGRSSALINKDWEGTGTYWWYAQIPKPQQAWLPLPTYQDALRQQRQLPLQPLFFLRKAGAAHEAAGSPKLGWTLTMRDANVLNPKTTLGDTYLGLSGTETWACPRGLHPASYSWWQLESYGLKKKWFDGLPVACKTISPRLQSGCQNIDELAPDLS